MTEVPLHLHLYMRADRLRLLSNSIFLNDRCMLHGSMLHSNIPNSVF
jgi:hypothetical protein